MGGGAFAVLLVLGGAFYTYKKLTAEPPPPPPRPKPVVKAAPPPPSPAATTAKAMVEKAKEEAAAPLNEVLQADRPKPAPVAAKPAETPVPVKPAPAVEAPPSAPEASVAFKAWVENVRISGISQRAGKPVRIEIGHTAYVTGDLVNPQLGIVFESYIPATRMLVFSDKSGAKVERQY